jgi:hypothetical protein
MRTAGWIGLIAAALAGAACGSSTTSGAGGGGSDTGTPVTVPATWACGTLTCHAGQICVDTAPGTPDPFTYACVDLPAGCEPTTACGCHDVCSLHYPDDPCGCDATGCFEHCVAP